jgi:predicted metal-binding protein
VPYKTYDSWVKNKIVDMKKTLESKDVLELYKYYEKCAYLNTEKICVKNQEKYMLKIYYN